MGAQLESGNGAASIEAREDEFLGNFELLDDTLLQFEYILSFIGDLNAIPEEDRTDDGKVEGCASNAWLMLEARNGRLKLSLGSDSLIIEGLLGALTWMLDTQPLEDVAAWQPRFLNHPQMKPHLNSDRSHGIASIVKAIQTFCVARTTQLGCLRHASTRQLASSAAQAKGSNQSSASSSCC